MNNIAFCVYKYLLSSTDTAVWQTKIDTSLESGLIGSYLSIEFKSGISKRRLILYVKIFILFYLNEFNKNYLLVVKKK